MSTSIPAGGFGYTSGFDDPLGQEECGRGYVLEMLPPPRPLLHGKLLWLHSENVDIAYVGSHNLTMSGYNDQLEDTVRLESSDPSHLQALRSIHGTMVRLLSGCPSLREIWPRVPVPAGEPTGDDVRFVTSIDAPIASQLADVVGEVDRLVVVTPF